MIYLLSWHIWVRNIEEHRLLFGKQFKLNQSLKFHRVHNTWIVRGINSMVDPFLNLHALSVNCQCTNKVRRGASVTSLYDFCFFVQCQEKRVGMWIVHFPPEARSWDKRLVSYKGLTFELQNIFFIIYFECCKTKKC